MFAKKSFSLRAVWMFSGHHVVWILTWVSTVTCIYLYTDWHWLFIPTLPISVIGIAVAFYVGFKNSQSYDRMWEARKIWGAIVNSSRFWGISIKSFITNKFTDKKLSEAELHEIKTHLIHRHIAWLYILRDQLLVPTPWEHLNQGNMVGRLNRKRIKIMGTGLVNQDEVDNTIENCLNTEEKHRLSNVKNKATQLIDIQAEELTKLREQDIIEDFRHMELQNILKEFYEHQGKAERIKKFPFPRQYGAMSNIFIGIFIFLLPFAAIPLFAEKSPMSIGVGILVTGLIAWVFLVMELVGDYSENPFEGLANDIPMMSLCRTIEIDLRDMLGEENLPPAIETINGILM